MQGPYAKIVIQYLESLNPASRRQRQALLAAFAEPLGSIPDLMNLSLDDVLDLRPQMLRRFKPVTVNNALSAFRGVLKVAAQSGVLPMEKYFELDFSPRDSPSFGSAENP